jgi:hypothetical protein
MSSGSRRRTPRNGSPNTATDPRGCSDATIIGPAPPTRPLGRSQRPACDGGSNRRPLPTSDPRRGHRNAARTRRTRTTHRSTSPRPRKPSHPEPRALAAASQCPTQRSRRAPRMAQHRKNPRGIPRLLANRTQNRPQPGCVKRGANRAPPGRATGAGTPTLTPPRTAAAPLTTRRSGNRDGARAARNVDLDHIDLSIQAAIYDSRSPIRARRLGPRFPALWLLAQLRDWHQRWSRSRGRAVRHGADMCCRPRCGRMLSRAPTAAGRRRLQAERPRASPFLRFFCRGRRPERASTVCSMSTTSRSTSSR